MELLQAKNMVNDGIGNLVVNHKNELVDALNDNGFQTIYDECDYDITYKTLSCNQLSQNFRKKLVSLLAEYYVEKEKKFLNFAAQQDVTPHFTLNNLDMGNVVSTNSHPFINSGLFANADGKKSITDWINTAVNIYSTNQMQQAQQEQASAVLAHDANQIALAKQQLDLENARKASSKSKITNWVIGLVALGAVSLGSFWVYKKYIKKG
jgi:hypothetical protein